MFGVRAKAESIRRRLEQVGIPAEIHVELGLEKLWYISKAGAGPRIEVPMEDFERANRLLLDWDAAEGVLRDAIRCPECKSLRVLYPQFAIHSLLTNLALGLTAKLGLFEKHYYCEACHYTWPKQGARPRRDRPNMAPYYFIEGIEQTPLMEQERQSEPSRKAA